MMDFPPQTQAIPLHSGSLQLHIDRADLPLEQLCGFASRRSHKRGFVFVSKVLGKHYPVRPRVMAATYDRLAAKLTDLAGPVVVIALAETATGLGQGVYESLWRQSGRTDLLFLHSTRYQLRQPLALQFDESHSHATAHRVYLPPDPEHAQLFARAQTLVLIDDELSTGRTLESLALAYQRVNPAVRAVHFVCLTDWLGARRKLLAEQLPLRTQFHSLLAGRFHFEANPAFAPGPIPDVTGNSEYKDVLLARNHGRLGQQGLVELPCPVQAAVPVIAPGERVLVLGSGEFTYLPYRLALELEQQGHDVYYQSTTRSPLLVERDLASALEFIDNYHDDIPNYLYNVRGRSYEHVLIGYETRPLPRNHRLPEILAAQTLFF